MSEERSKIMDDLIAQDADLIDVEPVAWRYGFDGYGWQYIDGGSGSDWAIRHPDGEPLYAHPPADLIETQAREVERLRERLEIDPTHSMDGIYARDETIRGLDAQLAKFKALAETLAGALHHRGGPLCPAHYYGDAQCTCGVADALRQYKEQRDAS